MLAGRSEVFQRLREQCSLQHKAALPAAGRGSPSGGRCAPRCPGLCTWMTSSQTSPRAPHRCSHAASPSRSAEAGGGP